MLIIRSLFFQPPNSIAENRLSPKPEISSPLSLESCIAAALKNNPNIKAEESEAKAATDEKDIAKSSRLPLVQIKGTGGRYLDDQRLIPARSNGEAGVFSPDIGDIGLVLKIPLFSGGKIINSIKASELNESAFIYRLSRSKQELIFNVTSIYYTILGREKQLESLLFSLDVLKNDRKRINALIEVQKAARVDLLRMDVRLAKVEQAKVKVVNEINLAWRILYNLMGIRTKCDNVCPKLKALLTPVPPIPDPANAFESALKNRPDLLAKQAQVQAQSYRVNAARGERLPQIQIEGSYGYRFASNASSQPDNTDTAEDRGVIGLNLEIPVFDGGRITSQINRDNHKYLAIKEELNGLSLQIQKEVESAMFSMQSALQRVNTQETAITQAKEALRIEQEKYALGKGTILDVLDAQNALLEIETEYYQALAEYHISIAQFRLATGEIL